MSAPGADPLAAIRQRAEQATPGPWEFRYATGIKRQAFTRKGDGELKRIERKDEPVVSLGDDGACGDPECCGYTSYHVECSQDNGDFIAHAREDIPFLLKQWDTHQSALRALVAQFKDKEAATRANMKSLRQASMDREAGELRASVQAYAECADALERLLSGPQP